jgi:hypothetical protein
MNAIKGILRAVAAALLGTILVSGCATQKPVSSPVVSQQSMSTEKATVEKVVFTVSNHGKSIVDSNGVEIARAVGNVSFGKDGDKMQGCMRCSNECIRYDSNGNCIQTIRSCTWDFDCP